MRRVDLLAIAVAFFVSSAPGVARATFFQNTTGLVSPSTTVTFGEIVLTPGASLTNQYSAYGVTFSGTFWSPIPGGPPNIDDQNFTNFLPLNPTSGVFSIYFTQPVSAAAVAMANGYAGTAAIQARLLGSTVDSGVGTLVPNQTNNYFGFTNVSFDEIRFTISTQDRSAVLDNLQYVPEPGTALLLLGGLAGMALRRRT